MRIQHNISALNSWGRLGVNQNNAAKNLEKLSSGYRINRAGDDAAGLAISEKMRGQIRGLDMASKNAQDGISLIQTAEGALDETHSILQRMRELAVQSANGTYQDEDRANTDLEIQALKSELDRISSSTHFNKIQLLDGSLGGGSSVKSVNGTDASNSITSAQPVAGGADATPLGETGAGTGVKFTAGKDAVYNTSSITGGAFDTWSGGVKAPGSGMQATVAVDSTTVTLTYDFSNNTLINGKFNVGDSITINGKTITFDTNADAAANVAAAGTIANAITSIADVLNNDEKSKTMTLADGTKVVGEWKNDGSNNLAWAAQNSEEYKADLGVGTTAPKSISTIGLNSSSCVYFDIDFADTVGNFKNGETITMNGMTLTFDATATTTSNTDATAATVAIGKDLEETLKNIAFALNGATSTSNAASLVQTTNNWTSATGGAGAVTGTWSADGKTLTWTSDAVKHTSNTNAPALGDILTKDSGTDKGVFGSDGKYDYTAGSKFQQQKFVIAGSDYKPVADEAAVGKTAYIDLANAKAGDTIQIGSRTFELVEGNGNALKGNIAVTLDANNAYNTALNLRNAIEKADIDGLDAMVENDQVKIVSETLGKDSELPQINIGTIHSAVSGITKETMEGVDHTEGGSYASRGFHFDDVTGSGTASLSIQLKDKDGLFQTATVAIEAGMSGDDVAKAIMSEINKNNSLWNDGNGNNLYTADFDEHSHELVIKSTEKSPQYNISKTAISVENAGNTNYTANNIVTENLEYNYQDGKRPSKGGSGATTILDFANAGVGDTFRVDGKDYEIVASKDDKPVTSGANAIVFNSNKAAMVADIAKKLDETNNSGFKDDQNQQDYTISANGTKLTLVNDYIGSNGAITNADVGSIGTNAKITVGDLTIDFGKTSAFNDYNINLTKGDDNSAVIDTDAKTLSITVKDGATADDVRAAIREAMRNSGKPEMADEDIIKGVKVEGEIGDTIGTPATNASTEISFKSNLKAGDTIKIGDTTYQVGKAGDTVKNGNTLLEVTPDGDNFTGAAVAQALAGIQSDKFTITADGNKAIITAKDGVDKEAIAATVNDSNALVFQIGANGSADQRVSMNIDDMSAKGIGVDAIDITNVDAANSAIDVIDNAINTVSATRANLGAMQNRLEHTINSLNTTSENLTAAESRIRDVDMAKEMMAFTKNNILTQAAQAMLAQANQQPQGVLQLLQ